MAIKLSTDDTVYFVNFLTANNVGDPTEYATYPNDLDSNFASIRTTVNRLVDEVNALGGSGALINFELVQVNDAGSPGGVRLTGRLGHSSYQVTINGGDASDLDVTIGAAVIPGNQLVRLAAPTTLSGLPGGARTDVVAIDTNGTPTIESTFGAQSLDIASAEWNGTVYTSISYFEGDPGGTPTDGSQFLASIMPDGDEHRRNLRREVTGNFSQRNFFEFQTRIHAIEQKLQNISTDDEGFAIGDLKLDAAELTLGLVPIARGGTGLGTTPGDSNILVGTGAVYALESGGTMRTSLGLGTGNTPQFARLGLGAAASGTASELALLSRAGDVDLLLTDTGNAALAIRAGAVARFATTSAHDLEFYRGGVAAANRRLDLHATGVDIYDENTHVAVRTAEIGGTASVELGLSGGKVGFFGTTPIALPSVGGVASPTLLAELATVVDNLIDALDASGVGLINDTRA